MLFISFINISFHNFNNFLVDFSVKLNPPYTHTVWCMCSLFFCIIYDLYNVHIYKVCMFFFIFSFCKKKKKIVMMMGGKERCSIRKWENIKMFHIRYTYIVKIKKKEKERSKSLWINLVDLIYNMCWIMCICIVCTHKENFN